MNNELTTEALINSYHKHLYNGDYEGAKKYAEILSLLNPQEVDYKHKVAYTCFKQSKWKEAIEIALQALLLDNKYIPTLDLLAHAYGELENWENAGHYGQQALILKDAEISAPAEPMPIDRYSKDGKKLIAFSLFGKRAKYLETAVLNVQVSHTLFPNWVCRFYIDETVPEHVLRRLKSNGAEIIEISEDLKSWPGAMWRFLAINDPEAEYVIFRDTDSVISAREAAAVAEWIKSGCSFHIMRDSGSHTALMLAGMWGAKVGSISNMKERIQKYINDGYSSTHFADQDFLAAELWGYIRQDLLSHDRLFNFREPKPFPELPFNPLYQIAFAEGIAGFETGTFYEEGTQIRWTLYSSISPVLNSDYSYIIVPEFKVCSYETTVKNRQISDNIPRRYAHAVRDGLARIEIEKI